MKRENWTYVTITKQEIIECAWTGNPILSLLKQKGAPINGSFDLNPDPTYLWKRDDSANEIRFGFRKQDDIPF